MSEISVCGHSDCGALKRLLQPEHLAKRPAVARWLSYAQEALAQVTAAHPHAVGEHKLALLCQFNVRVQLRHLLSHPAVRARGRWPSAVARMGLRHPHRASRTLR